MFAAKCSTGIVVLKDLNCLSLICYQQQFSFSYLLEWKSYLKASSTSQEWESEGNVLGGSGL